MLSDGDGRIASVTRQGVAAAVALARRLGLPADDPVVLSSRGNLLVHYAPAPVVARVATLTASTRRDPFAWLAREVAVAAHVAGRGGPVVAPTAVVDPGPYREDGFAISLWQHVVAAPGVPEAAQAGVALARLHHAARDCPADIGDLAPVTEQISDALDTLERESLVDSSVVALLRSAHADVLAELAAGGGEPIVLHGDAHTGNLLAVDESGWLWTDLEETSRGPAEWDLAVLAGRDGRGGGLPALRAYAAEAGTTPIDIGRLAPFHRARALEGAVWTLCVAHLFPSRYAQTARDQLAEVLPGGAWASRPRFPAQRRPVSGLVQK
jgi:hypothetical protein